MKKGNKKLLIVAALLLLIGASITTYAIYKSSATGNASADVASWVVKVNGANMTTGSYTFDEDDITWNTNANVKEGKIAPGSTGTITLEIDASESEVAVDYEIALDTEALDNSNISISSDDLTGSIAYSSTASAMKKQVTLNVTWTATDSESANTKDLAMAGDEISIPVVVTAKQKTTN